VVVIGYGLAGHLVTASLRNVGVRHVILDLNADNIREGRSQQDPVYYADATSAEAVGHAHVQQARAVVVLINDPQAAFRVIDTIRRVSSTVPIFIRTRYLGESAGLIRVGASDVVAEEVEGGVEILARLLRALEVPRNVIDAEVHTARESTQESARAVTVPRQEWSASAQLSGLKVEGVLVLEGSAAACRSPRELDLRVQTGALLVAVLREGTLLPHPPPDEPLRPGDVAYLIGDGDAVQKAIKLLGEPARAG
jgi:CPA2 family monovalent cation:H+ antiporter-2